MHVHKLRQLGRGPDLDSCKNNSADSTICVIPTSDTSSLVGYGAIQYQAESMTFSFSLSVM